MINEFQRRGLFTAAFAAITATSFCFVLRALVIDDWGSEFALSATQKGELLGVGLWPFSISIVMLSLLIDRIGFKASFWLAASCHLLGLLIMLTADGYWGLYLGTFILSFGNGAVEASANPLIATLYAEDRPTWLNRLHAAWPGGMIVGGVLAIVLGDHVGWRVKIALMFIPVIIYGILLVRRKFPVSERVAAGVPFREMLGEAGILSALVIIALIMAEIGRVAALPLTITVAIIGALTAAYGAYCRALGRPLYLVLVLLMIPLATTELSTDGWISSLMAPEMRAIGLQAGWVLVYTSMLVFVARLFAGAIIHRVGPIVTLGAASALAAMGLFLMAGATGPALLAAATLYGVGKSFFWGTSLAVASDQFPRGGAVTINIVAGAGMLAAGVVGSVLLGSIQDGATASNLRSHDAVNSTQLTATYMTDRRHSIFGEYLALDAAKVAKAPPADAAAIAEAEAEGQHDALRSVAFLPLFMLCAYALLGFYFRIRGGYRRVEIKPANGEAQA